MAEKTAVCCLVSCVLFILTLILVIVGWSVLTVNEVGLDYSANSLTLDMKTLYTSGPYFLGVGHSFERFPKTTQEVTLNGMRARTSDGQLVILDTKILYRIQINIEALSSMYLIFQSDHANVVTQISNSVIRDVASDFTAFQFWKQRDNITLTMANALENQLTDVFCNLENFLLNSFTWGAQAYKVAIDLTDAAEQETRQVEFQQKKALEQAIANITKANARTLELALEATAVSESVKFAAEAAVFRINETIAAELRGYKALKDELEMTSDQLVTLIWQETFQKTSSAKTLAIDVPDAISLA